MKNPDGSPFLKYANFDPALINDDGVIRLYSGTWYPVAEKRDELGEEALEQEEARILCMPCEKIRALHEAGESPWGPHHMTLGEDMMTLTSEPVRVLPLIRSGTPFETDENGKGHGFFEGSSIRKISGKYYFVYSSRNNHELCYAVSDEPDHGFVYGGVIVSNGDIGYNGRKAEDRLNITGTTHGSIECINGQWFVFYHRLTHKSDYSRQACAEKIMIDENGRIKQAEITGCGLNEGPLKGHGIYPAVIYCNLTNGQMPHSSNQEQKTEIPYVGSGNGEQFIRDIRDHTLIGYKYFAFEDLHTVTLKVKGEGTGVFCIFADADSEPAGEAEFGGARNWTDLVIPISGASGVKPLYIRYSGTGRADMLELTLD